MTPLCFIDTETTGLDPDRHEIWEVAIILRESDDETREQLLEQMAAPADRGDVASSVPLILHGKGYRETEFVWQLPVDLARADQIALNIGHFYERRWPLPGGRENHVQAIGGDWPNLDGRGGLEKCRLTEDDLPGWAERFMVLTWGAHMIGAVPSFDTDRLWRLLRRLGACPGWHYQPIDVETVAAGYLNAKAEYDGGQWKSWHAPAELEPPWDSEWLSEQVGVNPARYERHSALGDARWARDIWDSIQPTSWKR